MKELNKPYSKLIIAFLLFLLITGFSPMNQYFNVKTSHINNSTIINIDTELTEFDFTIHGKNINYSCSNQTLIKLPRLEKGYYHIVLFNSDDKFLIQTIEL